MMLTTMLMAKGAVLAVGLAVFPLVLVVGMRRNGLTIGDVIRAATGR